jgi:YidC/Oxa1 family membrane protein insertase
MFDPWNLIIIQPMINSLLFLYQLLGHNLTLTILVFTVLIRLITFPLNWQAQQATKKQQALMQSDEYKKMQEKYGKDREKMAQEQMKMYQQAGINPFGSCLPMLIQFPVLIGLYQAITNAIAASPTQLLTLSTHLYPFMPNVASLIPLDNAFLWLNLGLPDPFYVMPVLVAATTWVQSKVMTPPASPDPQTAQMSQTMAFTSTLMFAWFSLSFASGLSIYFIVSNLLSIAQYAFTQPVNWRNIFTLSAPAAAPAVPAGGAKSGKKKK